MIIAWSCIQLFKDFKLIWTLIQKAQTTGRSKISYMLIKRQL